MGSSSINISDCYNDASINAVQVEAQYNVGGIVGAYLEKNIQNCYNVGQIGASVKEASCIGGLGRNKWKYK